MPPVVIKKLSSKNTQDARVSDTIEDCQYFEDALRNIYFDSEFIDPIEVIVKKVQSSDREPLSIPFSAYLATRIIAFFSIDFSNPPIDDINKYPCACWLDSFMVARDCQGQGYAKTILNQLPDTLSKFFPDIRQLNLTVNFRNHGARALYTKCGFENTGDVYWGGPAGPQHILTKTI
jgi:GNAT superfamily N-acetyltransferase